MNRNPQNRRRGNRIHPQNPKSSSFCQTKRNPERATTAAAMEDEGIEAVLAKAIDLRMKISNCIQKGSVDSGVNGIDDITKHEGIQDGIFMKRDTEKSPNSQSSSSSADGRLLLSEAGEEDVEEDEEAERLLHIRDAFESLEHQLSNLQALQHQQRYEREVALSEIENSRKMLLEKLKEYKGEDLAVIQEASAFAGESVEHRNDLLLPPYPSRPPQPLVVDNNYVSHFPSTRKPARNGVITGEVKKNLNDSEGNQSQTKSANSSKGLGHVIGTAAKTLITLVGVVSVLSLSGLGPNFGRRNIPLNILGLFQPSSTEEKRTVQCPPGRVLVVENGEARCIVKERVAVPFESVAAKPDVNYGSG